MHDRNLTTGVTLTEFRMYGGEMTADNSPNIVLDMGGCDPGSGCSAGQGGATFSAYGTYFAQSGGWMAAIQIRGNWNNVEMIGSRAEFVCNDNKPGVDDSNCQFLNLMNATLNNFQLSTYGDGDATHNMIHGTGSINGGLVIGSGNVALVGDIHGVSFHCASRMNMTVDGSVIATSVHATRHWKSVGSGGYSGQLGGRATDGFGTLNVTREMEIDNGGGGPMVHRSVGPAVFMIGPQIALMATYSGSSLGLQCAHEEIAQGHGEHSFRQAGNASLCAKTTELAHPAAKGKLSWECEAERCRITADGDDASVFTVRKMA